MSEFKYMFLKRKLQREIASFIRLQNRNKDFEEKKVKAWEIICCTNYIRNQ